jgi:hypothetical protein
MDTSRGRLFKSNVCLCVPHDPTFPLAGLHITGGNKNSFTYRCWFARSYRRGLHRTFHYNRHKDVGSPNGSRAICCLFPPTYYHAFTREVAQEAKQTTVEALVLLSQHQKYIRSGPTLLSPPSGLIEPFREGLNTALLGPT